MSRLVVTIGAVLIPSAAAAHPEHLSGGDFGLAHFVADPFHVALTVAAVLLFLALRRSLLRSRPVSRWVRRSAR